jgi:hypothetical protein
MTSVPVGPSLKYSWISKCAPVSSSFKNSYLFICQEGKDKTVFPDHPILGAVVKDEWLNCMPHPLHTRNEHRYPIICILGGPQSRSGGFE